MHHMIFALSAAAGSSETAGLVTEAIKTSFTNGLTSIQIDVTSMLVAALPIGLALFGLRFAVMKAISFFKGVS